MSFLGTIRSSLQKQLNSIWILRTSSLACSSTASSEFKKVDSTKTKESPAERKVINAYAHNPSGLMQFFDNPKNWNEQDVKTGRPWKKEELRIKSNEDLHKLWYVLLKERNMLLTMQEAHQQESRTFPSEERVDKVEESMTNLESVVKERNRAYWQLEVSQEQTGTRPWVFRKDTFGRYFWQSCNEHLVHFHMNRQFKRLRGPGYGHNVTEFVRRYREKQMLKKRSLLMKQSYEVRQLLRRFPDIDLENLQLQYPRIPVAKMQEDLHFYKEAQLVDKSFIRPDNNKKLAKAASEINNP